MGLCCLPINCSASSCSSMPTGLELQFHSRNWGGGGSLSKFFWLVHRALPVWFSLLSPSCCSAHIYCFWGSLESEEWLEESAWETAHESRKWQPISTLYLFRISGNEFLYLLAPYYITGINSKTIKHDQYSPPPGCSIWCHHRKACQLMQLWQWWSQSASWGRECHKRGAIAEKALLLVPASWISLPDGTTWSTSPAKHSTQEGR